MPSPSQSKKAATTKRSRKRKKNPLPWGAILGVLLVGNLVAGFLLSPLTALATVRFEGARAEDQEALKSAMQMAQGQPWARTNKEALASAVLRNPRLESVTIDTNVFGRGVVKLTYKRPVAIVAENLLLSDRGDIFPGRPLIDLPTVNVPKEAYSLSGTIVSAWDARSIAGLCETLRGKVPNLPWTVDVDEASVLSLRIGNQTNIRLGSAENLDKKVGKLLEIIDKRPELLKSPVEINLVSPDEPVFKPLRRQSE